MARRRGVPSPRYIGLLRPHHVIMRMPELGFGKGMDAMVAFFQERRESMKTGEPPKDRGGLKHDWIVFCFRESENADDFAGLFNGERYDVPEPEELWPPRRQ
jgi:hypothetical protein